VNSDQQYYCDPPIRKKKIDRTKAASVLRGNQRPERALLSSAGLCYTSPASALLRYASPGFQPCCAALPFSSWI
jgi:hypothetical protein